MGAPARSRLSLRPRNREPQPTLRLKNWQKHGKFAEELRLIRS